MLLHPVAIGTLLAALVTVGLGQWFIGQSRSELAIDRWNRGVIVEMTALADVVASLEAADKEASPEQIGSVVARLRTRKKPHMSVTVVSSGPEASAG